MEGSKNKSHFATRLGHHHGTEESNGLSQILSSHISFNFGTQITFSDEQELRIGQTCSTRLNISTMPVWFFASINLPT